MAEAKLAEFLKEHRERVNNSKGDVSSKMTFAEAAAIHLQNLDDNRASNREREIIARNIEPGRHEGTVPNR